MNPTPLIVGNFLSSSRKGSRCMCENLAERLMREGFSVVTASDKPSRVHRLVDMLLTAYRRREDYAIAMVEVYSGPSFLWAECVSWVLRRLRKPIILTLHGGNLPAFAQQYPRRVQRLLTSASRVTTPSKHLYGCFQSIRKDLVLLPNAIDVSAYSFRLRSKPDPKLVWLRAFSHIYNPCMASQALGFLLREFPTATLAIAGRDTGDGSLPCFRSELEKRGLASNVRIMGPVKKTDVPTFLSSGDVFLNTTNHESFGVSVMEAAACGLCIVSTDAGELPLLWKQGSDAMLVPCGDAQSMAQCVKRVLQEPGLGGRLSFNARAKSERYDWPNIIKEWRLLMIDTLLDPGPTMYCREQ